MSSVQQSGVAVIAMISSFRELFERASERLAGTLGPLASICEIFPFDSTEYYQEEMGSGLLRTYVTFTDMVTEDELKRMKRIAESLETEFYYSGTERRRINLDPGILTTEHLVLASHKSASHRIYIGGGVYAEVELVYQNGDFQVLPWTYPDYRTRVARDYFKKMRSTIMAKMQTRS